MTPADVSADGDSSAEAPDVADAVTPTPLPPLPDLKQTVTSGPITGAGGLSIQPGVAVSSQGVVAIVFTGNTADSKELSVFGSVGGSQPISLGGDLPGQRNEPSVCALSGGGFAAAWSFDGQKDGGILNVEAAVLDASGGVSVRIDAATDVEGNHWLGDLGCDPRGGFLVVGARTDTDGMTFGVFGQRYQSDGSPDGDAFAVNPISQGTQAYPSAGLGPDGTAFIVYEDQVGDKPGHVVGRVYPIEGKPSDLLDLLGDAAIEAKTPDVSVDPASGAVVVGATIDNAQITVLTGSDPKSPLFALPLPSADDPRFLPAVAFLGRPDAIGAVYIQGTGESGRIQVAILGSVPVETAVTTVAEGKLPPYGPSIGWGNGRLVAAWTERVDGDQFAVFTATFE